MCKVKECKIQVSPYLNIFSTLDLLGSPFVHISMLWLLARNRIVRFQRLDRKDTVYSRI
jgi:hypothetical protein